VRPSRRARVLVIDDEVPLLHVMRDALADDFEVTTINSGKGAIELLSSDLGIDVILCDLMMPEMSGADVFRWIESHRPTLTGRVVFVTGGAFSQDDREFIDSLPNARVDKPFALEALVSAVRSAAGA
jgi:CheY-like chemotaxis protein